MVVIISIPRQIYRRIRSHLFKDHKEQGCFLFSDTYFNGAVINLRIKEIRLIKADTWQHQSEFHLELKEAEKVKVMVKARRDNYDLIECHSHRCAEKAVFSHSDVRGLDEFVRYVWWKLPGKIYAALVWTEIDVDGQAWLPQKSTPLSISEIRIVS